MDGRVLNGQVLDSVITVEVNGALRTDGRPIAVRRTDPDPRDDAVLAS